MFYVYEQLYGYRKPEIISKHRTIEAANKRKVAEKNERELSLSMYGWNPDDGTKYYVEEIKKVKK